MSSYYREHLSYPAQEPQHYHQDVPDNQQQDDQDDQYAQGPIRRCSVRGCSKVLAPDYALKMCEQCREKHRIYANTKRAKRKLEKAALGTQTGVTWVPSNVHENNPQSSPHGQHVSESPEPQVSPQYSFSPAWDNSAIDPRLFSQPTTSSELAGALTLPDIHGQQLDPDSMSHSLSEDGQHDVPTLPPPPMPDHSSYSSPTPSNPKTPVSAAVFTPTHGEISAKSISEAVLQMGVAALPARYCSIKGCKAVVPANSYFKMCEPCRNRYRSYGTTKRAKWRREKEVAVAELQKLQVDEVQRRVETGVPIIPDANVSSVNWSALVQVVQNEADPSTQPPPQLPPGTGQTAFSQTTPKGITPRMCTVSHCREILPGDYEYLRCERHRIQNRHHSKLKRVRDKESKAIAYHDWAAAVNQHGTHHPYQTRGSHRDSQFPPPDMQFLDDSGSEFDDFDDEYDQVVQAPPEGEAENGIPPAARGSRRTNHSCSNKTCCNLLSLENPWRMCEFCRAHDRETRRAKTLRDGAFLAELLTRTSEAMSSLESDKKRANKKDGGVGGGEILEGVRGERRWEDRQREPRRQEDKPPTLVFMEPVLAEQTGVTSEVRILFFYFSRIQDSIQIVFRLLLHPGQSVYPSY
ncbi:hypothetical protein C8Q75DRAFT_447438 [Abortiporus biennis]|nr:hypothetical protein C8Q75DRAFT_447438 [Abortiporus biennis]